MSNPNHHISVHEALGGGPLADILLWRNVYGGVVVLIVSTFFWVLFEMGGGYYNVLAFVANNLLLLVVILFFWAKSALWCSARACEASESESIGPLPPIPNFDISENLFLSLPKRSQE
ncbi:reticulon-like protein B11 [Tanacetum coccineum]